MVRQFVDRAGRSWRVFEVVRTGGNTDSVRPELKDGWLTFQSGAERWRLARGRFPSNWASLSDAELERLRDLGLQSKPAKLPVL